MTLATIDTNSTFILQRKKTLLVEYRQLRKANAFVDRRFGEEDESLTAEEKAIARFQKQRMKDFGGKSRLIIAPCLKLHNRHHAIGTECLVLYGKKAYLCFLSASLSKERK